MQIIIFALAAIAVQNAHVCDLEMLKYELKEDIDDNGVLDCLRINPPPNGYVETDQQLNRRLNAQWDTDCSFEMMDAKLTAVRTAYGIKSYIDQTGAV